VAPNACAAGAGSPSAPVAALAPDLGDAAEPVPDAIAALGFTLAPLALVRGATYAASTLPSPPFLVQRTLFLVTVQRPETPWCGVSGARSSGTFGGRV
jgi:hypothetical protein